MTLALLPQPLHHLWLIGPVRFSDWLWAKGPGYQWSSSLGIAFFFPAVYYWHHTCHVKWCFRWGHPDVHGHPACKRHHTQRDLLGIDPHDHT